MIKVFITRKVADESIIELMNLLKKLRSLTLSQPGYVSGETMKRIDTEGECMVISTWRSIEDWNAWLANPERVEVQAEIDKLLGAATQYAVYG